jgi:subtilisin family serine protease
MKFWTHLLLAVVLVSPAFAEPLVTAIISLEGEPLAALTATPGPGGAARAGLARAVAVRRAEIAEQQAALRPQLTALGAEWVAHHDTLLNAVVVRVPAARLAEIKALPGVVGAQPERLFERHLETSTPFLGAPAAWRSRPTGLTGAGLKIGIIDSGIDYQHAMFGGSGKVADFTNNDPTRIEPGSFPTAKVLGGTDFVGDGYDAGGSDGSPAAVPDPDPLDHSENGHGTHVAGIAAGLGVLTNGVTFRGSYLQLSNFGQFEVGPGVAPEASLYALKVFGRRGSTGSSIVVAALEWALDPNRDGNFSDRLDVVNLSLGSAFGLDDRADPEVQTVNRISQNGVLCVISAGNSGNLYYVAGSPGVAARAITVANSFDDGAEFESLRVVSPPLIAGDYDFVEGAFTPALNETGPITGEVVYVDPPLACDETLANAAALRGKIALIDRGTCFFVDKIRRAQTAGARAVIMVNNTAGTPITMGGTDASDIVIPGVMITRANGAVIKSQLATGVTVTLAAGGGTLHPELADQLSDSSSRGPLALTSRLKPDLSAPGTGIKSAKAGAGTAGVLQTGTSMSAPQVAGAAALVRQARPTWTPEDVKAVLMNTAATMQDGQRNLYPESRVGAGRMDVQRAISTAATARVEATSGEVSLSFGLQVVRQTTRLAKQVRLHNFGGTGLTFNATVSNSVAQSGVTFRVLTNNIIVGAGQSVLVDVQLEIDPTRIDQLLDATTEPRLSERPRFSVPEASGQVWFTSSAGAVHLPWHAVVRAAANFDVLALGIGLPNSNRFELPTPTRGPSAHAQPVVSGFLLGGTKNQISAFGAATDFPTKKSAADATVYFGVALAEGWTSPQRVLKSVDVEIDTTGDGVPEYTIINSTAANVLAQDEYDVGSMNDALVSAVRDEIVLAAHLRDERLDEDVLKGMTVLGAIDPTLRDPALLDNSVLVHSAKAADIGLSATKTKFRYRILLDEGAEFSDWATFDLAKPVLDPTPYGLNGTPYFDEGRGVRFNFDRSEAVAAGFTIANSPRVLLLHHQNLVGARLDNLRLDLGKADADNDTLPDLWELEQLGEMTSLGTGDADGDGQTNAQELAAGTNPLDVVLGGRVESADGLAGAATLRWTTTLGRYYTVQRSDRLSGPFAPLQRRIAATPPANTFTLPDAEPGQPVYYRVLPD